MPRTRLNKAAHVAYSVHLNIYTQPIPDYIAETVRRICSRNRSELLEWGVEPDHIHFLVSLHPDNTISQLVKSFKSASTKVVIAQFPVEFRKTYWKGHS